nr:large tegument protein [Murid betaherpesvirus 2]
MRIVRASRDQSDPTYGARAGSQCMSNCFAFLHASYLLGTEAVLDRPTLDAIMDTGAEVDAIADEKLRRQGVVRHPHRLGSEIPSVIESRWGITGHALSRPFNGTAQTQDLGGYKCLGILDFLAYAKKKREPVHVVVTVGAHTRGLVLTERGPTYLFDPHTTDRSKEAAVYICETPDEVVDALAFFGAMIGDFYYDATIVYHLALTSASPSPIQLLVKIMDEYRDPDIDAQDAILPPPKIEPKIEPKTEPTTEEPTEPTTMATTPPKQTRKRPAPDVQKTPAAKPTKHGRRMARIPEAMMDLLVESMSQVEQFRAALQDLPASPPADWTVRSGDDTFHRELFTDTARQLLAHKIEKHVTLDRPEDPAKVAREFEELLGLSGELDHAIDAIRTHEASAPALYRHYLLPRMTALTSADLLLAGKVLALFEGTSESDFRAAAAWIKKMLKHVPVENASVTDAELDAFVENNPLTTDHAHVCLRPEHVRALSDQLAAKRSALKSKYIENDATYKRTLDAISKLGLASNAAAALRASDVSHLDDDQLESLEKAAETYVDAATESAAARLKSLTDAHHNRIVTGSMPETEMADALRALEAAKENVEALEQIHLIDTERADPIRQLHEDLAYLRSGDIRLEITPSEEIRRLRGEYETARKQISDREAWIQELIENIEDMATDPETAPSPETLDLWRSQIQEAEEMAVDETNVERAERLLRTLTTMSEEDKKAVEFVQKLSPVLVPSQYEVKCVKRLRNVLSQADHIREEFTEVIIKTLAGLITQLSDAEPPSDETLLRTTNLIEHLPPSTIREELLASIDTVSQLTRRLKNAINQKYSIQTLEDVMDFFTSNGDIIKTMSGTTWGKPLIPIYRKLAANYAQKLTDVREAEWLKQAKSAEIDSPETLARILATAPNQTILDKVSPELHLKLKKRMEAEAEKRSADLKRIYEEMKKKAETELRTVSDSFVSQTPSTFSSIDLRGTAVTLNKLYRADREQHLRTFNANLAKSLDSLREELEATERALLLAVVKKLDPQTTSPNDAGEQKRAETLQQNARALLAHPDLLVAETQRGLTDAGHRLSTNKHLRLNWRDAQAALTPTKYMDAYKAYVGLRDDIQNESASARRSLNETFERLSGNIHDNTSQQDITVKVTDHFSARLRDAIRDAQDPFAGELSRALQASEATLKDLTAEINANLRTRWEHHKATRQSQEARWRELVMQHRIRAPDGVEIDTAKLTSDTVLAVNRLVTAAETTLPYVTAKRALEWTTGFLAAAIQEKRAAEPDTPTAAQMATLLDRCHDAARTIEEMVGYNTRLETETLETSDHTTESLSNLQLMLQALDPKRIVGGEKRHKAIRDMILAKQNRLAYAEELEKLSARYFELLRDVRGSRYGLDFEAQLQKIQALRSEVSAYKRDPGAAPGGEGDRPFPRDQTDEEISVASLLTGIASMERYVTAQRTLLDNLISSQPLVSYVDNIPAFPVQEDNGEAAGGATDERSRRDAAKLSACDVTTPLFRCLDAFGERRIMTGRGIQLYVYASQGNFVFETHSHVRSGRAAASATLAPHPKDPHGDVVTRRYKSVTVIASIAATLQAFWTDIAKYDVRNVLDGLLGEEDRGTGTVANLKLFVYEATIAWSEAVMPIEPGHPHYQEAQELSLLDYATLMSTLHPEYVYAAASYPPSAALATMVTKMDRRTVDAAMNARENPPPYDISDLKAFCVDTKTWRAVDTRPTMWHADLIKQMCTSHPRNRPSAKATKLFLYLLATKILPKEVLRCLWAQFKPRYAMELPSLETLTQALCELFFKPYSTSIESRSGRLPTGETIERQIFLRQKVQPLLLDEFAETDAVLDHILGSYVFAVPMTYGIHAANLLNGRYRLIVRHLENVPDDPDFNSVIRSRDLSFSQFPWTSSVQNPVERSWFSIQEDRLRELLQNPSAPPSVPLVVYNSSTNYVVTTVVAPTEAPAPRERATVYVKNPFSAIRIPADEGAADPRLLTHVPLSIDFLKREPPRPRDPDPGEGGEDDSTPGGALNAPLFAQNKVSTIVPRDAVTTVSSESASSSFPVHPFRALSSAIRAAVKILQETRSQLEDFEADMYAALRRLKILYLH